VRDDFTQAVKEELAKRAGFHCSNPKCRRQTSGPQSQATGSVNIGVAAHITAAAPQGPRYDATRTAEERQSAANGIWLCQTCAHIVDRDLSEYSADALRDWKAVAEAMAFLELRGWMTVPDRRGLLKKLEGDMPELFAEMRGDLQDYPFCREFILRKSEWCINSNPNNLGLEYYFENHPHLRQKIRILENNGLVQDITDSALDKFLMSEEFVDYLRSDVPS
jgi:hypothetical protein